MQLDGKTGINLRWQVLCSTSAIDLELKRRNLIRIFHLEGSVGLLKEIYEDSDVIRIIICIIAELEKTRNTGTQNNQAACTQLISIPIY